MNIFELSEHAALKALTSKLLPDETSTHRYISRQYSTIFHTPLTTVLEMDPEKVLLALHEHKLDGLSLESDEDVDTIITALNQIEDPTYDKKRDEEEKRWNEKIAKQRATINSKEVKKEEAKLPKELPKSGGVNFAYLADLTTER